MSDAYAEALLKLVTSLPSPPETGTARAHGVERLEPVIGELVYSFLLWEASPELAATASEKLLAEFIDLNELRISLPDELVGLMGARYPKAVERATRLKMALNDIFKREHSMSLARLNDVSKRDARQKLSEVQGVPSFVTARVCLFGLGAHAFPLDERLRSYLLAREALDPTHDLDQCIGWVERQFRAGEAVDAYMRLEHAVSLEPIKPTGKNSRKANAKKT